MSETLVICAACTGTGEVSCEQCKRCEACTLCRGDGYVPSDKKCTRCGYYGCQSMACPTCGGHCDDYPHDWNNSTSDICEVCDGDGYVPITEELLA